jgi:hypothetical protein
LVRYDASGCSRSAGWSPSAGSCTDGSGSGRISAFCLRRRGLRGGDSATRPCPLSRPDATTFCSRRDRFIPRPPPVAPRSRAWSL